MASTEETDKQIEIWKVKRVRQMMVVHHSPTCRPLLLSLIRYLFVYAVDQGPGVSTRQWNQHDQPHSASQGSGGPQQLSALHGHLQQHAWVGSSQVPP